MSAGAATILDGTASSTVATAVFAAIVALLGRVRQSETSATFAPVPRFPGPRASGHRTERDTPDPMTVARDAEIVEAWQRGEIPGRHAPGGVR